MIHFHATGHGLLGRDEMRRAEKLPVPGERIILIIMGDAEVDETRPPFRIDENELKRFYGHMSGLSRLGDELARPIPPR